MEREIDMSEVSDGRLYKSSDMVKCGTDDCKDCSDCCHGMGESIILDPYDIYMMSAGTGKGFSELLSDGVIELHMVDGLLLPNIKMQKDTSGCVFLNEAGRCTIHNSRPGFCRLFPLGRIYNENGFDYFLQIHECPRVGTTKIKIKKWLGIPRLFEYEQFITKWHFHLKDFAEELSHTEPDKVSALTVTFLKHYYEKPYDPERSFYEQFEDRFNALQ